MQAKQLLYAYMEKKGELVFSLCNSIVYKGVCYG